MSTQLKSTETTNIFIVPNGDIVHDETIMVSPEYAKVLLFENTGRYSSARMVDEKVELISKLCICSNCKKSFIINNSNTQLSSELAVKFGMANLSLLLNSNTTNKTIKENKITCPFCCTESHLFSDNEKIEITLSETTTRVSLKVDYKHKCVYLNPNLRNYTESQFPLSTDIVFDKLNHKTFLVVHDNCGNEMLSSDITLLRTPAFGWGITDLINKSSEIKKNLLENLTSFTSLSEDDIITTTLGDLVLYNRFIGYPKDFYRFIPFENNTTKIYPSFCEIADKLADFKNTPNVYSEYDLPQQKSIKKQIFTHPQMLFYAKELSLLPFSNTDNLLKLLKSDLIYLHLSEIHNSPFLTEMLKPIIKNKGEATIVNLLLESNDISSAIKELSNPFSYQIPLKHDAKSKYSYTSNCYSFNELSTSLDFYDAASQLNNCLKFYTFQQRTIIGIQKSRKYVAAIQIESNKITQAYLANNRQISEDHEIYEVFKKWVSLKKLTIERDY